MQGRGRSIGAFLVGVVASVCALGVASGCTVLPEVVERAREQDQPAAMPTHATGTAGAGQVEDRLAALASGERRTPSAAGYLRSAFGSAWADLDGNGCNQRDDVLLRDAVAGSTIVASQGRCAHDVLAGVWVDPYTDRRIELDDLKDRSQAQAIQIDHIVPLAEAWVSGAAEWSAERRRAFANDLGVLLAVDGPTNASKGSADPAAWRPRKGFQCEYAARWIQVKTDWQLSVDPSERAALRSMLAYC